MMEENLRSAVAKLLGLAPGAKMDLQRVTGGGNNQAYKVELTDRTYFLKSYHQDPEDKRQRGATEFSWLSALWSAGVRNIPQPFYYADTDGHSVGLYEFVAGKSFFEVAITDAHVGVAADFIRSINSSNKDKSFRDLNPASEACFTFEEHWQTVATRIDRLQQIDPSAGPAHAEAARFVNAELIPAWQKISAKKPENFRARLAEDEKILSPSDFGFHNALILRDGSLRFIDFEYAGWDDPAKLVCDFFNQVAVPVPESHYKMFVEKLESYFGGRIFARAEILWPLYQLKWTCILLNHFLPAGSRRRKFALQNGVEWETLLLQQLGMAQKKLRTIRLSEE